MNMEVFNERLAAILAKPQGGANDEKKASLAIADLIEETWVQTLAHIRKSEDPVWNKVKAEKLLPHAKIIVVLRIMGDSTLAFADHCEQDSVFEVLKETARNGLREVLLQTKEEEGGEVVSLTTSEVDRLAMVLWSGAEKALARFKGFSAWTVRKTKDGGKAK